MAPSKQVSLLMMRSVLAIFNFLLCFDFDQDELDKQLRKPYRIWQIRNLERLRTKKLYFFVQKIQNWKFCARICQPAVGLSVQPFFFFGAFIIWGSLRSGFSINLADLWKILIMWQCDALLFPSVQCRRTFNLQRYHDDIFNATYFTGIGQH